MDWKGRGQRKVALADGEVVVRRVTGLEMASTENALPTFVGGWDGYTDRAEAGERTPEDIAAAAKYDQFFIARGSVEPRIWPYEYDATPEGHVHASAFTPTELRQILNAILETSGFVATKEGGESAATFPAGGAGADGGPGGGEVRDEPVSVSGSSSGAGGA